MTEVLKQRLELENMVVTFAAKTMLALGFLLLAAWFLHAFTQPDEDNADRKCEAELTSSMFRFAYMFSIYSFALLVLPFTAMLRTHETPPDAGPIRLLRACVQAQPAMQPASSASAVAVATGPLQMCPAESPLAGDISYPWLVSVGGVIAQQCGTGEFVCSTALAASSAKRAAASASVSAVHEDRPPLYRVHGGFVVPFYVVVFAFVGGVVNLTRRVPEYQKRSSINFSGSASETKVTLLEAREFVVFQIMQLVSSPFVAMVAYYALEPKSIASAVGLGFTSGFATESVLLLIRGMFNGLRPETTKTSAAGAGTAQLHVLLHRPGGAPVDKAIVEVRRLPTATPPLLTAVAAASGEVLFKAVEAGTVWVVATLDIAGGTPPQVKASQRIQLKAGETESIELTLA
jgi:hypothetical protein